MEWRTTFDKGVTCFKHGNLEQALVHMNQAAELQGTTFIIYDSRAAVHERLGNLKAALLDSKRVIDVAPDRWQGYMRSARLFDLLGKYKSAIKMVDHTLSRLRPEDNQRRTQLVELREKAAKALAATEEHRVSQIAQTSYLLGKLPVETLVEIFMVLIDEDYTWSLKLSQVCGHWRHILVDTPSAWQTLVLSKKHPLRKVKLWKQRSANRITHISVDLSELDRVPVLAELQDLSWSYVSSLRISKKLFTELHRMLCGVVVQHMLSKLDELVLFGSSSDDQPLGLSCCITGPDWKLVTLHLDAVRIPLDDWCQRIQRLKELRLGKSTLGVSLQVFATNPFMERLVLEHSQQILEFDPHNAPPIIMNHLKTVYCHHVHHPLYLLRFIIAPSITHFSMFATAILADQTLLHMASRSSLVELNVGHCSLSPSTLPTLLSSTPNLETLQVNNVHGVVNEMLQFLSPKTDEPLQSLPCRALKHVDVSRCPDLTTSRVYAFIKTRSHYASESIEPTEKCAVIASLRIDECPHIEPELLPWFRSKVSRFSCVYATKKDFKKAQRRNL